MPAEKQPDKSRYSGRIAARIRALRQDRGWDRDQFQAALARAGVTVSVATLYGWENGNKRPDPDKYPAIAKALGVTLLEFLPPK